MIDNTQTIVTTNDVLKIIDEKYDSLKNFYTVHAIENVLVCPAPSVSLNFAFFR